MAICDTVLGKGKSMRALTVIAAVVLGIMPPVGQAGESCTEDAMIVFDGSGSMAEMGFNKIGVPRISEARQALHDVLPRIASVRRLGLVIYGPGGDRTCRNTELRFGPQWDAAPRITAEVDALLPVGGTPLTEGVRLAAETLEYRSEPGAIVLITDGDETCGGEPCQLAAELAADGADLTVHVIGFKVRSSHFSWEDKAESTVVSVARCLADRTGGQYLSAETVEDLVDALQVTLGCQIYGQMSVRPRKLQ